MSSKQLKRPDQGKRYWMGKTLDRPWRVTAVSIIVSLIVTAVIVLLTGNAGLMNMALFIALLCSAPTSYAISRLITRYHAIIQGQNEELRQLNKELTQSNADLEAYAHMVAHDLKNPLTNMVGFANLLKRELQEGEMDTVVEFANHLEQTGLMMGNIVNELLLLAQVRNQDIVVQSLNMDDLVARAEQRLSIIINEYHGEIIHPVAWPDSMGYGPWIEEVWVNYISNAIKYGGTPPVLELGATPVLNGKIKFWVRDNGRGLTPAEQKQLFQEFTRLNDVRAEGHGLGLSIVRRIVEKLGGEVGVESRLGEGCLFYFTLTGKQKEKSNHNITKLPAQTLQQ